MKKIDNLLEGVDRVVDRAIAPWWHGVRKYFSIVSATILFGLSILFVSRIFYTKPQFIASLIREDLAQIEKILDRIDKDCSILSIRSERAFIDFLTVEKFVGSAVGSLNLAYPEHWHGPYLKRNPTLQEKLYEIVRTKEGLFVVPGKGVALPNGLVMGKDVVIEQNTLITNLMKEGGHLYNNGQALAVQLTFHVGDWDTQRMKDNAIEKTNEFLEEFNSALPYARNLEPNNQNEASTLNV